MKSMILRPALIAAAALGVAGCSSYGNYGYSGVSVGLGSYGGYSTPYYGWYDGYYYPGTGYYIYDRYGSRYRWNDYQRRYWEARRPRSGYRDNWSGYRREYRQDRREARREWRHERREARQERREDRREERRERRR